MERINSASIVVIKATQYEQERTLVTNVGIRDVII